MGSDARILLSFFVFDAVLFKYISTRLLLGFLRKMVMVFLLAIDYNKGKLQL